jgi:ParB-like chromosome segregation protein Spo0J
MTPPRLDPQLALARIADPPSNPNVMADGDFQRLVGNIRSEGFLQPALVRRLPGDEPMYEIVDGVHRTRAAREVGLDDIPAVILPADYPDEKARLLQIGMNRLRGQLDLTAVADVLGELRDVPGIDVDLSGFSADEITGLLRASSDPDPNDLLGDSAGGALGDDPEEDERPKAYELTVAFGSAAELTAVKKALRKVAGRGKGLDVGIKRALGLD